MYTHSGVLKFGKREEKAMRLVLEHAKKDLSYGWGGSYGGYDENNKKEEKMAEKAMKEAKEGIKAFEWILDTYKK